MSRFAVIIPAAGASARFGAGRNKLLEPLAGELVLVRAIKAFAQRADVAMVVLATALAPDPWLEIGEDLLAKVRYCEGGATRAESVRLALREIRADVEWVAVHDAARPLVTQALISRTFAAAMAHGAAVPALPVPFTVKQAEGPLPARVQRTLPRHTLWAMQTPQVMRRESLLSAFDACPLPLEQVTDDAQLLELGGQSVWLVEGEERNLKITTTHDLAVAETLLAARAKMG